MDSAAEDVEARWLRTEFPRRTAAAPAVSPDIVVLCEGLCSLDLPREEKTINALVRAWKALCGEVAVGAELKARAEAALAELVADPGHPHSDFALAHCVEAVLGPLFGTVGWWFSAPHPYLLAANGPLPTLQAAARIYRPSQLAVEYALKICEVGENAAWLFEGLSPVRPRHLHVLVRKLSAAGCREAVEKKLRPRAALRLLKRLRGPSGSRGSDAASLLAPVLEAIGRLETRFVWLGLVYRAPRREWGP